MVKDKNKVKDLQPESASTIEDEEVSDTDVETPKLDWKSAAKKLKLAVDNISSIDYYFKVSEVTELRERYNNKERTEALYNDIMSL